MPPSAGQTNGFESADRSLQITGPNTAELQTAAKAAKVQLLAALQSVLGLIWRRQVVRFFAFVTSYLTLVSRYGSAKVLGVLRVSVETKKARPAVTAAPLLRELAPCEDACVQCQVLVEPDQPRVDVVFIHGLHGSLRNTWRQGDWGNRVRTGSPARRVLRAAGDAPCRGAATALTDEPYANCWPKEWLPQDCPDARVIALDYTTDPFLWRPLWMQQVSRPTLQHRSKEMVRQLRNIDVGTRPIVWVAHSKGGLFVKQMLVEEFEQQETEQDSCVSDSKSAELPPFCRQTKGIYFYSVPHRGSSLALIKTPLTRRSVEIMEVAKDSPDVLNLHERFLKLCQNERFKPAMVSLFETKMTFMSVVFLRIVAQESADPDVGELYGIDLDHRQICKPRSRHCFLYRRLTALIDQVL
ncbi:Hypothetical predicted protein [Cloeon dipterum]|uniref:Protein SERAC1 n=1 Tax=Cloeon dipterum TaxID=197152 RepID=A0A8S1CQW1_9INSE|nr:Hypothetical predicted protein [Cloeon dipterum]